ncbi:MAG: MerR family transcriptional regulator [Acidimicrobiia bacterium]|nr:MerR family transcriptional regulator [Acidimicrobiia bacterium]
MTVITVIVADVCFAGIVTDEARSDEDPTEELGLEDLSLRSGVSPRTIRFYQTARLLPNPAKRGRHAIYREAHLERLRLIGDLRDRGLNLSAIRQLVAVEHPGRTVAAWLGVDATLSAPWSDDRPRVVSQDEVEALVGDRRAGVRSELQDAGYIEPSTSGTWLIPSPALLDTTLQLFDAGIDIDLSGRLRDMLRRRLARAVDDAVKLLADRTGSGFAGGATPAELATAIGALRPAAREVTSLILAQEVERALHEFVERRARPGRSNRRR